MLRLVFKKKAAQAALERELKAILKYQGIRKIGFPGGSVDQAIYSLGEGNLWAAFGGPTKGPTESRYWNAFGIYQPDQSAQTITVEINIAIDSNNGRVAGFFAEDSDTGDIFLMHSGKVGGGRPGIGKSAFLFSSKAKLVEVNEGDGSIRSGIVICKLGDSDLTGRVWKFVKSVQNFKDQVANGELDTSKARLQLEEFDKYSKEFSGKKKGARGSVFEYLTYHGDVVQKLYDDRTARLAPGESVFNSTLIDLFVKKNGVLSEVYEVKTGVGRQMLYTAIGQLMTHATIDRGTVAKILVVPAGEAIPTDFALAITTLGIQIRHFRLEWSGSNRVVKLE